MAAIASLILMILFLAVVIVISIICAGITSLIFFAIDYEWKRFTAKQRLRKQYASLKRTHPDLYKEIISKG